MRHITYALISLMLSIGLLTYLIPTYIGTVSINKSSPLLSPMFSPYLFAGILLITSLFMLISSLFRVVLKKEIKESLTNKDNTEIDILKLIMAIICIGGFVFLLPVVGVEIAVFLLFVGLLITVREKRVVVYITLLIVAILIAEFFIYVIDVPIPSSIKILGS